MKHNGIIEIEGIEKPLTNPTLEIRSTYFECIFIDENGDEHSRLIKEGNELFDKFE
jgi:hypothetical protein